MRNKFKTYPAAPINKRKNTHAIHWLLLTLMLLTAGAGIFLKPLKRVQSSSSVVNLEMMIPKKFGSWTIDARFSPLMPAPELNDKLKNIYDETLSRTYVNDSGDYVMLSIAYGGDQTGRLRVHRPESCYTGQGFQVTKIGDSLIQTVGGSIQVKRLVAQSDQRHEPITYWMRVGDSTVTGLIGQRLSQLRYGLTGEIPDGLIFRVSTITNDTKSAYIVQDRFITNLMVELPKAHQTILIGTPAE